MLVALLLLVVLFKLSSCVQVVVRFVFSSCLLPPPSKFICVVLLLQWRVWQMWQRVRAISCRIRGKTFSCASASWSLSKQVSVCTSAW